jgi:hypothetical protein
VTHPEEQVGDAKKLLKSVFPPADGRLRRDLWPEMLNRMEAGTLRLPWYDWALMALLGAWALAVPQGILQLLYQF